MANTMPFPFVGKTNEIGRKELLKFAFSSFAGRDISFFEV